jgi:hypothetical protein
MPFGTVRVDLLHSHSLFDERALSARCTDIQMIAGFRRSAGEHLPAVPGGLVLPFTHKYRWTNEGRADCEILA